MPLAPAFAPITLPTPTFASMAPPAPVQRSRRRSRSRQRSPRADAHVPRSRRRPIASLAAVMAAAAAGGGMHGYLQGRVMRSSKRQSRMMTRRTPGLVEVEAAWRIPLASARGHIRRRRYRGEIQDWMRAHRHAGHIRKLVITAHHGITLTTLTLATAPARTISSLRRWWRREAANDRVVGGGGWRHARLSARA